MAAIALFLVALHAFFIQVDGILIPNPDSEHKYKSTVAEFSLVDKTHDDPWDKTKNRKIMVSLFMPVPVSDCTTECVHPYMGRETAKTTNNQFFGDINKGVFERMDYLFCCNVREPIDASEIPVVVLEPHVDTSRLMYTNLARYMTANNVAVVLIDHPHDSAIVEFNNSPPVMNNGDTRLSNLSPLSVWNKTVTKATDIRTQDINLVLSHLRNRDRLARKFTDVHFTSGLNTSSYSIVGHGLGGSVATKLSISDPRVRFSINLSGTAPPLHHAINAPVYFIGRSDFRRENDINWPSTWSHLTGPATEFDLKDADIMDFTDLPAIVHLARNEGGKSHLTGFGLSNKGPSGSDAVKCIVEAYIRDKLWGETGAVSHCVRLFGDRLIPYMAGKHKIKKHVAGSRGALLRRRLEMWGRV
jgi:hypothetical protein